MSRARQGTRDRARIETWLIYAAIAAGVLLFALLAVFGLLLSRHPM